MKKTISRQKSVRDDDELRPEYDIRGKDLVRGKFYQLSKKGTNVILLEPDVFSVYHDSKSVNRALREVIRSNKRATA